MMIKCAIETGLNMEITVKIMVLRLDRLSQVEYKIVINS